MRLTIGKGMDTYLKRLGNLSVSAPEVVGEAIYYGADIVADAIKKNIDALPVDDRQYVDGPRNGLRTVQKKGLYSSFGIAKLRNDNGYVNVKAGFDGYNKLVTTKYPMGQPNAMIARTIESGNSFTKKHPFVAPAVKATKDTAEKKMAEIVDLRTQKIMNGG